MRTVGTVAFWLVVLAVLGVGLDALADRHEALTVAAVLVLLTGFLVWGGNR